VSTNLEISLYDRILTIQAISALKFSLSNF